MGRCDAAVLYCHRHTLLGRSKDRSVVRYAVLVPHNRHTMDEYSVSVLHCHRHTMLDRPKMWCPTATLPQAHSVG